MKFVAQQLPHYTQYLYNMQIINPAYVGVRADLSMSVLSRDQWIGVEGAPTTRTFSINGRLRRGLGIGTTFVNDKIGLSRTNNINIDVSYTLITSQYSRLSLGLKGGLTYFINNLADGITPDNDIYETTSGNFHNVGFGAFFYSQKYYVGLSLPYILETPQFYINDSFKSPTLSKNPNLFMTAGYLIPFSEKIKFKPSTIIRYTTNEPISIDVNFNLFYEKLLEMGISYRHQGSLSTMFAINLYKKFRIGYAYDHQFNFISGNFGTHEIILHIDMNFNRNTHWLLSNHCYF